MYRHRLCIYVCVCGWAVQLQHTLDMLLLLCAAFSLKIWLWIQPHRTRWDRSRERWPCIVPTMQQYLDISTNLPFWPLQWSTPLMPMKYRQVSNYHRPSQIRKQTKMTSIRNDDEEEEEESAQGTHTYRIFLTFQVGVQPAKGLFQFGQLFWIGWCFGENLWVQVGGKAIIQCAHIEVQTLIDLSACLWIRWIKWWCFTILFHQVHHNCAWLPQCKTVIDQCRHGMLWINLFHGGKANLYLLSICLANSFDVCQFFFCCLLTSIKI